ncbi:phosphodiester glycosidase family protein [Robertkochia aurantiaca]|uniref:phosphodiester glycosidase family protein n=1 Tax=Robertkochia aurantiaca TaxID=2873700 RepID=UPI001CC9C446|nr:phosphodiester glycosidase family protein [Robertkochia sp. 3YJGBD-33]
MPYLKYKLLPLFVVFVFDLLRAQGSDQIQMYRFNDSLYGSPQQITALIIDTDLLRDYEFQVVFDTLQPRTTSQFAKSAGALAAINGSFFNTKTFQLVTYAERNDEFFGRSLPPRENDLINASVVIGKEGEVWLEEKQPDSYYRQSAKEKAVLASGPRLLQEGKFIGLPKRPAFVDKRHPRSAIGSDGQFVYLVAVDGRQPGAAGMSLKELQGFMIGLGCKDALNLDGGGSTTLWMQHRGVLNKPSDSEGERPVANALILVEKQPLKVKGL